MNPATLLPENGCARRSYREANARQRVAALFDAASVQEFLAPGQRVMSPHLALFDTVGAFDDGVMVARARLGGQAVLLAAQEGAFMGGAVGEVHGAKLTGLLQRALHEPVAAVLLLLDSGGVRLHEANAGLLAVSEVMRALLQVRAHGVPVLVLIGGANGAFGGSGIVARCANSIIMSEEGRLAMSGPEVIESAHGVEEFDARDRALVWATTGGKHRYLLGDCQVLVADQIDAFRQAALAEMARLQAQTRGQIGVNVAQLTAEHAGLTRRLQQFGHCLGPHLIWQSMGLPDTASLPLLDAAQFVAQVATRRMVLDDAADAAPFALADQLADQATAQPPDPPPDQSSAASHDSNQINWRSLAQDLFPQGFDLVQQGSVVHGSARLDGQTLAVIGTCEHTPIGVEIALQQARLVLDVLREHPRRPIVLLVDTQGQRLRHRDEMLGINSYMAHLGKCIELARQQGHPVLALVYDQALSGGFLTSGLMADACHALPQAQIRVMALPAMARITKVPQQRLQELASSNPVFAPGAENYWKMGGLASLWQGDLAQALRKALQDASPLDQRARLGLERGGRQMAWPVMQSVSQGDGTYNCTGTAGAAGVAVGNSVDAGSTSTSTSNTSSNITSIDPLADADVAAP